METYCHLAIGCLGVLVLSAVGHADAVGSPATVDQEVSIRIDEHQITVDYLQTLNRPGAYLEVLAIDSDGDGRMSSMEQQRYFDEVSRTILAGLELSVNGQQLALQPIGELQLSMPFSKRMQFQAPQPAGWQTGVQLEFHNENYLAHEGAATVTVATDQTVTIDDLDPTGLSPGARSLFDSRNSSSTDLGAGTRPPANAQQRDVTVRYQAASPAAAFRCAGPPAPVSVYSDLARIIPHAPMAGCLALVVMMAAGILVRYRGASRFLRSRKVMSTIAPRGRRSTELPPIATALKGHRTGVETKRSSAARRTVVGAALACALGMPFTVPWLTRAAPVSQDTAEAVFVDLHRKIYDAFAAQTESELYDVLATSLDGAILNDTYLDIRRLTMSEDAGTSFAVRRVKPLDCVVLPTGSASDDTFRIRHRWRVYGVVLHHGHRHARINEYEATFTVDSLEQGWRITDADVRGYHRADPVLAFASILP